MKLNCALLVMLMFFSCKEKVSEKTANVSIGNEEIALAQSEVSLEVYDFDGFQKFLNFQDDKVHVINFWATWCGPCVKELPYFEKLNTEYKDDVEVVLVSLDFPHVYDSKLKPFIKKKGLQSKVIALNAPNENEWINAIDPSWSGSIPATIIFNKDKSKFYEKSFTFEELEKEVKQLNN
ncbi:MAG: TlpA family protein disulfide reductase [Jejuia sp.]